MAEKACQGGNVLEIGDFAECAHCGTRIRWDLRDHPFWGFQNCAEAMRQTRFTIRSVTIRKSSDPALDTTDTTGSSVVFRHVTKEP